MSHQEENKAKHLYFMGICGTAMGSVAAAFRDAGYRVTGSDAHVYDPMKPFLESRGIEILDGYRPENLSDEVDLFVIGNAQSRGNPEVEAVLNRKDHYISMPALLREQILRGKRNFVVSGTHGKTTTSSLLAWIFESAGKDPGFVIGGLPGNLGQGARFTDSDLFVLEGDEYDSAFFDKRSKFIHYLLCGNPTLSPPPHMSEVFPPLPEDCSGRVQSRLKGLAYYVTTCFDLATFKAGVDHAAKAYKGYSAQVMTEMKGVIAMAQVLADGNIPVRFIILLDY